MIRPASVHLIKRAESWLLIKSPEELGWDVERRRWRQEILGLRKDKITSLAHASLLHYFFFLPNMGGNGLVMLLLAR